MTTLKWRTMLTRADVHQPAVYSAPLATNPLVADKQKSLTLDDVTRVDSLAANAQAKETENSDRQQARPQDNPSTGVLTLAPAALVSTVADNSAKATPPPTVDAKAENIISSAEVLAPLGNPCAEEAGQPAQDVAGSKAQEQEQEKEEEKTREKAGEKEEEREEEKEGVKEGEKEGEEKEETSSTAAFPSFSISQVEYINVPILLKIQNLIYISNGKVVSSPRKKSYTVQRLLMLNSYLKVRFKNWLVQFYPTHPPPLLVFFAQVRLYHQNLHI
jgi:hypothetical protein